MGAASQKLRRSKELLLVALVLVQGLSFEAPQSGRTLVDSLMVSQDAQCLPGPFS